MLRIFKVPKDEINIPIIVILIGILLGIYHVFSYLIPFTSHAFVVTNVTPMAANVSDFVTKIYVDNGAHVKKGDPLLKSIALLINLLMIMPKRLTKKRLRSSKSLNLKHKKVRLF